MKKVNFKSGAFRNAKLEGMFIDEDGIHEIEDMTVEVFYSKTLHSEYEHFPVIGDKRPMVDFLESEDRLNTASDRFLGRDTIERCYW